MWRGRNRNLTQDDDRILAASRVDRDQDTFLEQGVDGVSGVKRSETTVGPPDPIVVASALSFAARWDGCVCSW